MVLSKIHILTILIFILSSCKKDFIQWDLISTPKISNVSIIENNLDFIKIESNCLFNGNDEDVVSGFYWSTHDNPSISDSFEIILKGEGSFSKNINWSKYPVIYLRAFSKNSIATVNSDIQKITWNGNTNNKQLLSIENISITSFTSLNIVGEIDDNKGYKIDESGFCISELETPTIENSIKIEKSILNNLSSKLDITNIDNDKKLYVSFYTKSIVGYSYSPPKSFILPKQYNIGDKGPAGGVIFYQRPTFSIDWNFLEVASEDVTNAYPWGLNISKTNIISKEVEKGYSNSESMVTIFGDIGDYSALVLKNININNYKDWYLPSLGELILIRDLFLGNSSLNLENDIYWSSTEDGNFPERAWVLRMPGNQVGSQIFTQSKLSNELIRPIRRF